jgi:hypothetical protein
MSAMQDPKPMSLHRPQRATESFAAYCAEERKRRESSGEPFDAPLFDQVVDLVTRKLEKLEQEGLA